jgi:hypothetical protein
MLKEIDENYVKLRKRVLEKRKVYGAFAAVCLSRLKLERAVEQQTEMSKNRYGISVSVTEDEINIIRKKAKEERAKQQSELFRITSGIGDRVNPESASNIRANKIEEAILGLMLLKIEHLQYCSSNLTPDDFVTPFCKKVFESIVSSFEQNNKFDIGYVQDEFSFEQVSRITKMLTERERLSKNDSETLISLVNSLKIEKNKKELPKKEF